MEDFLESCRAPALLNELEDDDDGDDALDSDKENEPSYHEVVSIVCSGISILLYLHYNISVTFNITHRQSICCCYRLRVVSLFFNK